MPRLFALLMLVPTILFGQDTTCNNITEVTDRFTKETQIKFTKDLTIGGTSSAASIYAWCEKSNGSGPPFYQIVIRAIGKDSIASAILLFSNNTSTTLYPRTSPLKTGGIQIRYEAGGLTAEFGKGDKRQLKKILEKRIVGIRLEGAGSHDIYLTEVETDLLMKDLNCLYDKWR
jgi:hypothetical protein